MRVENEFYEFLITSFRSRVTGNAMTLKAARDAISRCRRVERVLTIELCDVVTVDGAFSQLESKIKLQSELLGATQANPYGYNAALHAVRLYRSFAGQRPKLNSTSRKQCK